MGFIRGNETLTLTNTYLFGTLRRVITSATHLALLMPGTIKRNYLNNKDRKGAKLTYYLTLVACFLIFCISAVLDVVVTVLMFAEYIIVLITSPLGVLLYPLTQREDSINTFLLALEFVCPKAEVQKLDTYVELLRKKCEKARGKCGKVIALGGYREIDWACDHCIAVIRKLKELGADPEILDKVNVRGHVISEYCPLVWNTKHRLIQADGLSKLMKTDFLVMRTYDVRLLKWKRVFVRFREQSKTELKYELRKDRTECLTYAIENQEEFIALKSFSVSAKDWNKLHRSGYNNRNRQFIKLAGSAILLSVQAAVGLLQIERNNSVTLKTLAILVSTQLAWFQVLSEAVLADVPRENITEEDFQRVSTARARAIRYVDTGDEQNVFSGEKLSWYVANTLIGSSKAKPVLPIELLLNANRLVTNENVCNFSLTGLTVWQHKVVCDEESGERIATVDNDTTARHFQSNTPDSRTQHFRKGSFLVG